jgi:Ti-type conjugative transfer relaxase TraA
MAIYHFSGTVISRSQGRSAVACAAYRSAEELHDERYGRDHDYTSKKDVEYKEILLPEKAPTWMADREKLWNAVEQHEKRKDAQLAREFNFSLPRELTLAQNTELAREFVKKQFVDKGMVADLCIHNDKMPNGEYQPHAHVMLTMREVTTEGFGKKVREWNVKEKLLAWREQWAEVANRHLALHDHDIRIDHRSFKDQGIELEPQHKIGAAAAQDRLVRMADHVRIARENGERLLADPNIALDALTRQQATFTHHDLAKFVNRHTADAEQFQAVYEKVKASEQLISLGRDEKGRERLTTVEMRDLEHTMLANANDLKQREGHRVSTDHQTNALASRQLTAEQQTAFEHLIGAGDLKCVVGYAGTGKSYLLGAAREVWEKEGYRVLGATLSGIAAENLAGSSGIESRTLASRFYYWNKGEQLLTNKDVLVIDEAGMVGSQQMAQVMAQAERANAKVVLIGDPQQLQAIEAGAAFRSIVERTSYVELTDIRRQQEAWQQEATRQLAKGEVEKALSAYEKRDHVHAFDSDAATKEALVAVWNDVRLAQPDKTQIMLAYTRDDVKELNTLARELRQANHELGKDHECMTERGERTFARGERIYFLKNNRTLGVMNGTLGTIEKIDNQQLTVRLDPQDPSKETKSLTPQRVTIDLATYQHVDYGYAATIHKAQGVTVDRSYLLASKYVDAHAAYVGLSRHRESTDIFWSQEAFKNRGELIKSFERERPKDMATDYIDKAETPPLSRENFMTRGLPPDKTIDYDKSFREAAKQYDVRERSAFDPLQGRRELTALEKADDAISRLARQIGRTRPLEKEHNQTVDREVDKPQVAKQEKEKTLEKAPKTRTKSLGREQGDLEIEL